MADSTEFGLVIRNVLFNRNAIYSIFPPQIVGYGSSFYCFWIKKTREIAYCVLNLQNDDTWSSTVGADSIQILGATGATELTTAPPTLAYLDGMIHVVFPDEKGRLIHIRLNPTNNTFGRRYAIGAETSGQPCIAVFKDMIFCAYTLLENPGQVAVATWDRISCVLCFFTLFLASRAKALICFHFRDVLHRECVHEHQSCFYAPETTYEYLHLLTLIRTADGRKTSCYLKHKQLPRPSLFSN